MSEEDFLGDEESKTKVDGAGDAAVNLDSAGQWIENSSYFFLGDWQAIVVDCQLYGLDIICDCHVDGSVLEPILYRIAEQIR